MQIYLICVLTYQLWIQVNANSQTTQENYKNCINSECTQCKPHYFLVQLQSDNDENYESVSRICVECPYQAYMLDEENLYCGDCLDNSLTWNFNRVCSYDYLTYSTGNSVYHKKNRASIELYYVVQSQPGYYSTMICNGCHHFCKEKSQNCFLIPIEYQNDINNKYVSCKEGYDFDEQRQICISCPQNCHSCIQNTCLICNKGFSKMILRESYEDQTTQTFCIPCFSQCNSCYFGKNDINLNVIPWDAYNNEEGLYIQNFQENQIAFFEKLFSIFQIAQRCEECESTTQIKHIPSLNRRSCVQCGTQCARCEYYSYWQQNKELISPSKNTLRIIEPQNEKETQELLESQYVLRCRECRYYSQLLNAQGTSCFDCKINDCELCHKTESQKQSKDPFTTLNINFEPPPQEDGYIEKCVLCKDGYFLTETGMCLIFDSQNQPDFGCLTFERSYDIKNCRKCQQDYTLYFDQRLQIWKCIIGCDKILQDPHCESCVKQNEEYRCQICKAGYYVDTLTNKCQPCSKDGYCLKCYTLTLNVLHHPEIWFAQYLEDSKHNQVLGPFCYQCIPDDIKIKGRGYILNEDLRKCEKGGDKCKTFEAKGEKGFCDQCLNEHSRSSSPDGNDCIDCPNNTLVCRIRSLEEIQKINQYYKPSQDFEIYSTLALKCSQSQEYMDTKFCRCLENIQNGRQVIINVKADCSYDEQTNDDKVWHINDLYEEKYNKFQNQNYQLDKSLSKNATIILETKAFYNNDENQVSNLNFTQLYIDLNEKGVYKIIINLIFSQSYSSCFFQKDTYFTTNIKKEVFSAQEIELNIQVENDKNINWYLQNKIYFEYFSKVTISGINVQPAVDCQLFPNIKKLQKPYSFQFIKNVGLIVKLENMKILNYAAFQHYSNKNMYTTPYSELSLLNKKFTPFYFIFTNVYDLQLNNVIIQSLNYLQLKDTNYKFNLFGFNYEQNLQLPYFNLTIYNVKFFDIGIGDQSIFDLEFINLKQNLFKIFIQQVSFNDVYFLNGAGFITPKFNNTLNGLVKIDNLFINNTKFNHSRGIVNFNNMQQIYVTNFTLLNSFVNHTVLYYITTIQIAKCYIQNTQFKSKGRMIQTQHELSTILKPDYKRLKFIIEEITFEQVSCLTPQCLISISGIKNDFDIPINITMKNIEIFQIQTDGFDLKILNATTSAAIKIEKSYNVLVQDFQSKENSNLSILYIDQVWNTNIQNIKCHQTKNQMIRNNYCLFISNLYQTIKLKNIYLKNLNAQDNSFIGISSWNNLIYNTTKLQQEESIIIEQVLVQYCTITTTQPGIPSSSIIISSNQQQKVQLSYMQFIWNKHFILIPGSLSPSNPTLIMISSVGNLQLKNSKWMFNTVQGFGAALYLESGFQTITNITMENNNDEYSRGSLDIYQPNQGGHLMIISQNTTIDNCTFYNSTAKEGGSIFIRTLKQGLILIKNTQIKASSTQLDSTIDSKGGCFYVDSKASQLNMTIINTNFEDCVSRQEGGAIYILSHQSQQQVLIQDTSFYNCFSLSGNILKVIYDQNQKQIQQTKMINIDIQANQSKQERFFNQLGVLKELEKYKFLIRTSSIEQDFGEIILINIIQQGQLYQGFLSVKYPSFIKLSSIIVQDQIVIYNPLIEIIEPIINPVLLETVKIANISSISLENIKCNSKLIDWRCKILQIRVDYPQINIQTSLIRFDSITPQTYLTLRNILINKIECQECIYGLVQIIRVSNMLLIELIHIEQFRCTDTHTGYYGCIAITSDYNLKIQTVQDKLYNFKIISNLSREAIINQTNIIPSSDLFQEQNIEQRLLKDEKNYQYIIPDPPYAAHVLIQQLYIENNTCFHGCGLYVYELTTNVTNSYITQNTAKGQGGFIYFLSKDKQRINIAQCNCYNNKASIGGCIAVYGVYTNNLSKTQNQIINNEAILFGNNINSNPQSLIMTINGVEQSIANLSNEKYLILLPVIIRSGYPLLSYKNQNIIIQFLDDENQILKYQEPSILDLQLDSQHLSNQSHNTSLESQNEPSNCEISLFNNYTYREFNNKIQGFNISDLIICYDPNNQRQINITFKSTKIQQPTYIDEYPYSFRKFQINEYQLTVKFLPILCEFGEYYAEQQFKCIKCSQNFYTLELNSNYCKEKDWVKMKNTYENKIQLFDNYWRPEINNDQVESCQKQKCIGNYQVGNELCNLGSIGALCEECDIHMIFWEQSYFKNWNSDCQLCKDPQIYLLNIFLILIQIPILLLLGHMSIAIRIRNIMLNFLESFKSSKIEQNQQMYPQVLLIIIYHMQTLSFLRSNNLDNTQYSNFIAFNSISMPALNLKMIFIQFQSIHLLP
ncbi:unnamed protein product [Paramecium primaurelia]|uniref:Transmembrane protein n=1 Tax=Paramecium primaurelia TaxID=5886 RepID=A0A8S1P3K2_PARPR|nr:unnamed protein product [Paramecium primaurelia]